MPYHYGEGVQVMPSALGRERRAREREEDRLAQWQDPEQVFVRRIQAAMVALSAVGAEAERLYLAENQPVRAPHGAGGGTVHPSRAAAIQRCMDEQGWSDDPLAPVGPHLSLEDRIAVARAQAQAEYDAADAEYRALLAARAGETASEPEPARRGRGRPARLEGDDDPA